MGPGVMSDTPSLTILSEEQKFNRENLLAWTTNMTQLLGSKGLSGYIDGKIPKPTTPVTGTTTQVPDPTPIYSSLVSTNGIFETNSHEDISPSTVSMLLD